MLHIFNISKTFGEIQSLRDINFNIHEGEIVGLLGDNGAGKSTLIKIITGYIQPDTGAKIVWKGELLDRMSVPLSRKLGIEAVYQDRALADQQPIWRNIFMGRELQSRGFLDIKKMKTETERLMNEIGLTSRAITAGSTIQTMSGGERQGIAIARALYFDAQLVILDEPTMGLSVSETRKVLEFVLAIKAAGKSCILIDHNIFHVLPVADRIVVLDRGRVVDHIKKGEYALDDLMNHLAAIAGTD